MDKKIKILAICGSPNKGNTHEILEVLQDSRPEIDFKILMLSEMNLKDCVGCYSCINNGEESCPLEDDRDLIIEEMQKADGTIFASPTYARMVSALMKKFIERTSFIAHRPVFFGKHAISLVTCAGFGANMTSKYLTENFTQCGFDFVASVELMMAGKTEEKINQNRTKALDAYEKLIHAIQTQTDLQPSLDQLIYFNIFKSISELNRLKGWADYTFYKDKADFYYEVEIASWKKKVAKWIAAKEVNKMINQ